MKDLQALIDEKFGVRVRPVVNPKISSIGTTAGLVLGNNPNRVGYMVINLSANTLYAHFERDVSSTKSLCALSQGEIIAAVWDEDFQVTGWALWVKGSAGGTSLYCVEFVCY